MSTHLNAFKQEAKEALGKVQAEVNKAVEKLDALVAKLDEDQAEPVAPTDPATTIEVADPPVAPATAHNVTEGRDSKGHFIPKTEAKPPTQ